MMVSYDDPVECFPHNKGNMLVTTSLRGYTQEFFSQFESLCQQVPGLVWKDMNVSHATSTTTVITAFRIVYSCLPNTWIEVHPPSSICLHVDKSGRNKKCLKYYVFRWKLGIFAILLVYQFGFLTWISSQVFPVEYKRKQLLEWILDPEGLIKEHRVLPWDIWRFHILYFLYSNEDLLAYHE